jgi:hypothetical protein
MNLFDNEQDKKVVEQLIEQKNNAPDEKRSKPFAFTEEEKQQLSSLSARLNVEQLANYFGISKKCFELAINRDPEAKKFLKKGRSKMHAYAAGKLLQQIDCNNLTAIMFYLKTRAGWREVSPSNSHEEEMFTGNNQDDTLGINTDDPNEASKIYQQIMLGSVKK